MNVCLKAIFTFALIFGVGFQASAKSKYEKEMEKRQKREDKLANDVIKSGAAECHWLGTPNQDSVMCDNQAHTVGLVQCGPWKKTAYCRTQFAGNPNACLGDDDGDTKKCFDRSFSPYVTQMKQFGKPGAKIRPACQWIDFISDNEGSDQYGNIDPLLTCDGVEYVFRRASCSAGTVRTTPLMFCKNNGLAIEPSDCMAEESNASTSACRSRYLSAKGRNLVTGEKAGNGTAQ